MATEMHEYVTADVADLAEEDEQAKVTIGGLVASSRRIITKSGSTMLVPLIEDLTGSVEVVVFPKVYEQTANAWANDAVVLVAGRIDKRDETVQLLCEAVWAWDDAVRMGPAAFGAERDRLLAPRNGSRWGNGRPQERTQGVWGGGNGNGGRQPIAVEAPVTTAVAVVPEPADEPPAPRDAVPLQATPVAATASVSVTLGDDVPVEKLLAAIESVKAALLDRPGPLPVTLSISVAGAPRQIRLPDRVAWDDRLADAVQRAAGVPVAVELGPSLEERIA
jgi:hypothetical protein